MISRETHKEKLGIPEGLEGQEWPFTPTTAVRGRMHRHDELEINLVRSGRARYIVEGKRYDLRPRTQLWLFPAQNHVLLDQSADFSMWIVVWRPRLVKRVCREAASRILREPMPEGDWCRDLSEAQYQSLDSIFTSARAEGESSDLRNAALAYILLLSWRLHCAASSAATVTRVHPAIERAATLLRDSGSETTLADIAHRVGFSASGFSRLWKEQTGTTLIEFRTRQCLARFIELYGEGNGPTALQAALAAGFGSYAQFGRVFRRYMGKSLAEYRRAAHPLPGHDFKS